MATSTWVCACEEDLARWSGAAANSGGAALALSEGMRAWVRGALRRVRPAVTSEVVDESLVVKAQPVDWGPIATRVHDGWVWMELVGDQIQEMAEVRVKLLRRHAGLVGDELCSASVGLSSLRWAELPPALSQFRDDPAALTTLGALTPAGPLTVAGAVALGAWAEELAVEVVLVSGGYTEAQQRPIGRTTLTRLLGDPASMLARAGQILRLHRLHPGDAALREVLINALSHRCYSEIEGRDPIRLLIYLDAFAVVSPGGMLRRVGFSQGQVQQPYRRNPHLHALLKLRGLAEGQGRGLPLLALVPGFGVEVLRGRDSVRVLFRRDRAPLAARSTDRPAQVLTLLDGGPMTRAEIQEALGVSRASTQKVLKKLVEDGRVVREAKSPRSPVQRYARA